MNKVFNRHLRREDKYRTYTISHYLGIVEMSTYNSVPKKKKPRVIEVHSILSYNIIDRFMPFSDDFMDPLPSWFPEQLVFG